MISIKDNKYNVGLILLIESDKTGELQLFDFDSKEYLTASLSEQDLKQLLNYIQERIGTEPEEK